jgi:hypothetical protein
MGLTGQRDQDSLRFLLGASFLSVALWFLPLAWVIVYPFRLFVTFIHEGGHVLATLISFGAVAGMRVHANGSGETFSIGGLSPLIASAGYLGTAVYGSLLLVLTREGREARAVIAATAALILALTVLYADNAFGWIVGMLIAAGLILFAIAARARAAHFFLSFLAVQCCLNAFFDIQALFLISAATEVPSDALNMQRMTGLPAVFWALLWALAAVAVLLAALRAYSRHIVPARV